MPLTHTTFDARRVAITDEASQDSAPPVRGNICPNKTYTYYDAIYMHIFITMLGFYITMLELSNNRKEWMCSF